MIEVRGKQQKVYLVQDTKTGATALATEDYAKKLDRSGMKRIIAVEGEKKFEEGKVRDV
jgi:hypothetical protein